MLAFDRDSADFARGVEVGIAFNRLASEPRPVQLLVHADNAEMVLRLAEAYGDHATATAHGDDWLVVTFD